VGDGGSGAELRSAGQVRTPAPTRAVVAIGVISDTHGLLRPEALAALRGSDYIIHAGDIGDPDILKKLAEVAPVTAVRGNVDRETWARKIPATDVLEVGGVSMYVLHNLQDLDLKPEAAGFAVVVSTDTATCPNRKRRTECSTSIPAAPGRGDFGCR